MMTRHVKKVSCCFITCALLNLVSIEQLILGNEYKFKNLYLYLYT
jgi:hypothetical protein